jgi:hypothetical protein
LALALASAGNNMPAKMAMIAMTTNNSMRVNARAAALRRERSAPRGDDGVFAFITNLKFSIAVPHRSSSRNSGKPEIVTREVFGWLPKAMSAPHLLQHEQSKLVDPDAGALPQP